MFSSRFKLRCGVRKKKEEESEIEIYTGDSFNHTKSRKRYDATTKTISSSLFGFTTDTIL